MRRFWRAMFDRPRVFHARDVDLTRLGRYGPGRQA